METPVSLQELKEILLENQNLLIETKALLVRQEVIRKRNFWLKMIWFFVLFVLPTILIYWYLGPIYESYLSPGGATDNAEQLQQINQLLGL